MDYKKSLPTSSNDPLFNLLDCYLQDFEEGDDGYPNAVYVDPFERDEFITELFGNETNYLGQPLFYTSGASCSSVESEETVTFDVQSGDNQFKPFVDSTDPNLQVPLNESNFLNGTAGLTLDTADIIWQFTENCLEGAWLKSNSAEPVNETMCWKIDPRNNEIRYPYPYMGSMGEGVEWSGKGINNCFVTPYVNPELKAINEEIENLYWSDETTTTSAGSIALNSSTLIDDGAHASNNYFTADQIKKKTSRDDTSGEEVAWLYQPTNTQLPISCGDNFIYYPLFKYEDGKVFNFDINTDQVEDRRLIDVDLRKSLRGAKAGLTPDDADQIFKLNGECGEEIEGAWLKSEEFQSEDVTKLPVTPEVILEEGAFSYDSGIVSLNYQTTKGGEEYIEIDCGEEVVKTTPIENVDISYTILTIPQDPNFSYSITVDENSIILEKESLVGSESDDTETYALTNDSRVLDGVANLYLTDEEGEIVSTVNVWEMIDCLAEEKNFVSEMPQQNGFTALFSSSTEGTFVWQFEDSLADEVINGYELSLIHI